VDIQELLRTDFDIVGITPQSPPCKIHAGDAQGEEWCGNKYPMMTSLVARDLPESKIAQR
jgi:hypothetical protein